jgi:hypothetical protein
MSSPRAGAYHHRDTTTNQCSRHGLPQLLPGTGVTQFVQYSVTRADASPVPADGVLLGSRQYAATGQKAVPAGVLPHGNVRQYKPQYGSTSPAGTPHPAAGSSPRHAGALHSGPQASPPISSGAAGGSTWVGGAWSSPRSRSRASPAATAGRQQPIPGGLRGSGGHEEEGEGEEEEELSALAAGLVMDPSLLL